MNHSACLKVGFRPFFPNVNKCIFSKNPECSPKGDGINVDLINIFVVKIMGMCVEYVYSQWYRESNDSYHNPFEWRGLVGKYSGRMHYIK